MGKKSSPPPPDYTAAAKVQGQESRDTAQFNTELNRVNQVTPYGSLTWTQTPQFDEAAYNAAMAKQGGMGPLDRSKFTTQGWTQTMTLDPAQQRLLDQQNAISQRYGEVAQSGLNRVAGAMEQPFDTSGIPAMQGGPQAGPLTTQAPGTGQLALSGPDAAQYRTSGIDLGQLQSMQGAMPTVSGGGNIQRTFDTAGVRKLPGQVDDASRRRVEEALMSRINPQYQADEQALRTRLLNSGIEVGTDAYNREMQNYSQRLNDARMQAVLAGGQEESRQVGLQQGLQGQEFGQALAQGQFGQSADTAMASNALQAGIANANLQAQSQRDRIGQALAAQGLNLQAQQQNYGMDMGSRQFSNQAEAQRFAQGMAGAQFGNAAQAQQFQQGLAGAQFGNQARQQALQEQAWLRQLPMNEVNALRTGAQVQGPQFQQYYTGGAAQGSPIFDAAVAQGNYNAALAGQQQGGQNALLGGLANLGSAWISSDIRLKTNIRRIGAHPSGVGRYAWDWKDGSGSSVGVLAQELQTIRPDAVREASNGFLQVNYLAIGGV